MKERFRVFLFIMESSRDFSFVKTNSDVKNDFINTKSVNRCW